MNSPVLDYESQKKYAFSWRACINGFEKTLANLRDQNIPEDDCHQLINVSSGKYVYHCKQDGFDFAYKSQQGKKFWRYIFRPSLPLRECANYRILKSLDFPVPQLIAVGETRSFFVLRESFLITSFIDGTVDGRIFMPGGKFREGKESLCRMFCEKNLIMLAKLHDSGFFHKASHPRNFLFRGDTPESMEIFWIDVARMRKSKKLRREIIVDLHTFFRDMRLPKPVVHELLDVYIKNAKNGIFNSAEDLIHELINFKRRAFTKRKYHIFSE